MNKSYFTTTNLKLAAALSAAGFAVHNVERAVIGGTEKSIAELEGEHGGWRADELAREFDDFENSPHAAEVDRIFAERGLTEREQVLVNFDAARTAGHNRIALLKALPEQPIEQVSLGGGRLLQFRRGTPKEELKRICR
jgi:hypothetical protein